MALMRPTRLGPYEIIAALGAGAPAARGLLAGEVTG